MNVRAEIQEDERPLNYSSGDDKTGLVFTTTNLIMGSIAVLAGLLLLVFVSLSRFSVSPENPGLAAGMSIALALACAGSVFLFRGIAGVRRKQRRPRTGGSVAAETWALDFPGQEAIARHRTLPVVAATSTMGLILVLLLLPFHRVAFGSEEVPWLLAIVVSLGDLAALVLFATALAWFVHWRRHGDTILRFESFPIRTGGSHRFTLTTTRAALAFRELTVILRCVSWRIKKVQRVNRVSYRPRALQTFAVVQTITDLEQLAPNDGVISFLLEIPDNAPPTSMHERPIAYWELEIVGKDKNHDSETNISFLVPVY